MNCLMLSYPAQELVYYSSLALPFENLRSLAKTDLLMLGDNDLTSVVKGRFYYISFENSVVSGEEFGCRIPPKNKKSCGGHFVAASSSN